MKKAFSTQNLVKPQMALEEKPQNVLLIISKYQQAKKRKTKQSQQIYVHIHMKKRAVSGVGEEAVKAGIDKPCIFTLR